MTLKNSTGQLVSHKTRARNQDLNSRHAEGHLLAMLEEFKALGHGMPAAAHGRQAVETRALKLLIEQLRRDWLNFVLKKKETRHHSKHINRYCNIDWRFNRHTDYKVKDPTNNNNRNWNLRSLRSPELEQRERSINQLDQQTCPSRYWNQFSLRIKKEENRKDHNYADNSTPKVVLSPHRPRGIELVFDVLNDAQCCSSRDRRKLPMKQVHDKPREHCP